jgi:pyrroloquinoline quinone biosynthesis protein B
MWVQVLGSAAGGGFPQWNCGCRNCQGQRQGTVQARARTQTSVALSADRRTWFLVHASPDIRTQIESFAPLHPRALRETPIAGILLTNGDLDQCLGLLSLRESQPLHLYATNRVRDGFTRGNVLYRTLNRTPDQITWHALKPHTAEEFLFMPDGTPSGLLVRAVPVPGKVPLHLEGELHPDKEDTIALLIRDSVAGRTLVYVPCMADPSPELSLLLDAADCLFFDGTFWAGDELISLGLGRRSAKDMGHWPLDGPDGSLRMLTSLRDIRRILIHINNTNPILDEQSRERRSVEAAGIEVSYDGMEVVV